ncbi:hypothetical protein HanXRQr2_Chr06g0255351 [Helianthus annuus]|uniref:Uncharacterized protein n=1 Tax=Helianthus annuus TaxID=4232 RepID=A0A9K3NJK9_HELAN|nr:hypothetical protein HanXRQr2_Chr06g0255351 [Helianthus annuus]KAJ0915137.1 hypothetical protein HanPSC8_Chr06g0246501 [Helianthus annuus]
MLTRSSMTNGTTAEDEMASKSCPADLILIWYPCLLVQKRVVWICVSSMGVTMTDGLGVVGLMNLRLLTLASQMDWKEELRGVKTS